MKITATVHPQEPSHPKYPWIGENEYGTVVIFTKPSNGTILSFPKTGVYHEIGDVVNIVNELSYRPIRSITLTQE